MTTTQATEQDQPTPWAWLSQQLDSATYCPIADPHVSGQRVQEAQSSYYILKNRAENAYLKLDESDYALWQLMDGSRTVKDLVVAHFLTHKTFAYGRINALVAELKANRFLVDKPVNVIQQVEQQLAEQEWHYRWRRLAQSFIEQLFPLKGVDKYVTAIYKAGGWLLFNPILQIIMLILAISGLYPFVLLLRAPEAFPIFAQAGAYVIGIFLLVVANTIVVFIHELAHALTTKHYGREVPTGGAMIYYGMPAFYVNTMDIWLEPKKHRIAVSWMGPFTGIFLGGMCSFAAILLYPVSPLLGQLTFKMAFMGYLGFVVNMNPLLELDGYFILMDTLDIPLLRQRALTFIKTELPLKLKALFKIGPNVSTEDSEEKATFNREEVIFSIFGILTVIYVIYIIWFTLVLWNRRIWQGLVYLWQQSGWLGQLLIFALGLALFIPIGLAVGTTLWQALVNGFKWLQKQGFFEQERNIALTVVSSLIFLNSVPWFFSSGRETVLVTWLIILAGVSVIGLFITTQQYAGSEVQVKFSALTIAATFVFLALCLRPFNLGLELLLLTHLAAFPLAAVGLTGVLSIDLRRSTRLEKWAIFFILLIGFGGAVVVARRAPTDLSALFISSTTFAFSIFFATLLPSLVAYTRTRFIIPWLCLSGGGILLEGFNLLSLSQSLYQLEWLLLVCVSLWAVGGVTYASAGWRIVFSTQFKASQTTMTEEQRLRHAFSHFLETLFQGFRLAFGDRRAQGVDDDLDVIAVTANWGITLDRGRVRDTLDLKQVTILNQAQRYREVLDRSIDLMDNWAGTRFMTRAAQAAYDSLPWPERESLGRYVLGGTVWGATLAHQFASVRSEHFQLLRSLPLFGGLSTQMLDLILARSRRETLPTDVIVLKEGKPYPYFGLMIAGEVEAWQFDSQTKRSNLVAELGSGATFGQQIFNPVDKSTAPATYRTSVPSDVLFINRADALYLLKHGLKLNQAGQTLSHLGQLLTQMPFFAELSPQQIENLLQRMGRQTVEKGGVIVRKGQVRQYFYIIEAGEVGVLAVMSDERQKLVARLGVGEHFGETALYTDKPYGATCVALTEVQLLTMDEFTFDRLIATSHQMSHYVEQVSTGRLKDTRRKLTMQDSKAAR